MPFEEVPLTSEAVQQLQATIRQRIVRIFVRRSRLDKGDGEAMCACTHGGGFFLDASVCCTSKPTTVKVWSP